MSIKVFVNYLQQNIIDPKNISLTATSDMIRVRCDLKYSIPLEFIPELYMYEYDMGQHILYAKKAPFEVENGPNVIMDFAFLAKSLDYEFII